MRQKTFDDIADRLPYSMNSISTIRTSLMTMTHSDWRSLSKPRHTAYIREYLPRPQMLVTIHMTLARTRKRTMNFRPCIPTPHRKELAYLHPSKPQQFIDPVGKGSSLLDTASQFQHYLRSWSNELLLSQ